MIRRLAPLGFAALLVACGGTTEPAAQPAAEAPADAAPATDAPAPATTTGATEPDDGAAEPAAFVPEALQFSAPLVGGGEIEMDSLAGRPVLLWFWAPW